MPKCTELLKYGKKYKSTLSKVEKDKKNPLTAVHFRRAKLYLIKQMQSECYEKELKTLQLLTLMQFYKENSRSYYNYKANDCFLTEKYDLRKQST